MDGAAVTESIVDVVGGAEFARSDLGVRPERIKWLLELLGAMYPRAVKQLRPTEGRAWTGLRPMSADGLPFVGPTPVGAGSLCQLRPRPSRLDARGRIRAPPN